jgi:hypothetical protein
LQVFCNYELLAKTPVEDTGMMGKEITLSHVVINEAQRDTERGERRQLID